MVMAKTARLARPIWLRPYIVGGVVGDDGADEIHRRAQADTLTRADMRTLLLAPPAMTNSGVRRFVIESLARRPEHAAAVLSAHCAQIGSPIWRATSRKVMTAAGEHFVAQASITVDAVTVAGDERRALDSNSAADAAHVSLLARLANLPQPVDPAIRHVDVALPDRVPWRDAVRSPVSVNPQPSLGQRLSSLDSNEFFGVLVAVADEGEAPREVIEQCEIRSQLGLLDGREIPILFFATRGTQWDRARLAVLHLLQQSADDHLIPTVLYDRFDELGLWRDPVRYERVRVIGGAHAFEVDARYEVDGAEHQIGPCPGADEWDARRHAQVRILAHLAGMTNAPLAPLERLPIPHVPGTYAWQSLRAAETWDAITDLDIRATESGPPFVATARCRLRGTLIDTTFAGPSADLALERAAQILLMNLNQYAFRLSRGT
ncbi:hypothetical protein DL991_10150 [Amycolatopsis sp. WAC 01375]|nr:hypothetical protein DL991_10150 [Amycolatopsis sp. WAC 01375]